MRTRALPYLVLGFTAIALARPPLAQSDAPSADSAAIHALEEQERLAVLNQDLDTLERIWSERFMVNSPFNQVAPDRGVVLDIFRQGMAHYASFDRRIERILLDGDLAIVMGAETVRPIGNAPRADEWGGCSGCGSGDQVREEPSLSHAWKSASSSGHGGD